MPRGGRTKEFITRFVSVLADRQEMITQSDLTPIVNRDLIVAELTAKRYTAVIRRLMSKMGLIVEVHEGKAIAFRFKEDSRPSSDVELNAMIENLYKTHKDYQAKCKRDSKPPKKNTVSGKEAFTDSKQTFNFGMGVSDDGSRLVYGNIKLVKLPVGSTMTVFLKSGECITIGDAE